MVSAATEVKVFSDDFESFTVGDKMRCVGDSAKDEWKTGSETAEIAKDGEYGNTLYMHSTAAAQTVSYEFSPSGVINGDTDACGIVKYELDILPQNGMIVFLPYSNAAEGARAGQVYGMHFWNGSVYVGAWGTGGSLLGAYTPGKWHHAVIYYYLNEFRVKGVLYDSENELIGEAEKTDMRNVTNSGITNKTPDYNKAIGIQFYVPKSVDVYVDNVCISKMDEVIIPNDILTEDFEKYTKADNMRSPSLSASKWYENDAVRTGKTPADEAPLSKLAKVDETHGQSLALTLAPDYDNVSMSRKFAEQQTGVVRYEFDVKPAAGYDTLIQGLKSAAGAASYMLTFNTNGQIYADTYNNQSGSVGTWSPGTWYHCVYEYDLDNKVSNVKIVSEDGTEYVKTWIDYESVLGSQLPALYGICLRIWADGSAVSYFDNIVVTKEEEQTIITEETKVKPRIDKSKVTFFNGDVQDLGDLTKISASVDSIKLDFGVKMSVPALKNAVKLTDLTDNSDVAVSITPDATDMNKMILGFADKLLAGHDYRLTVSAAAKSLSAIPIEEPFSIDFTTDSGKFIMKFTSQKSDGEKVTGLSNLTAGSILNTSISYENTTNTDKQAVLLYCYYNGNEMISVEYETIPITKNDKIGVLDKTHTIGSVENADRINIMLWNNFGSLVNVADSIILK